MSYNNISCTSFLFNKVDVQIIFITTSARELELKYNHEYQAHLSRYHAEVKEFESIVQGVRLELLQELSSLKIAI
jgi:hypothetical protein